MQNGDDYKTQARLCISSKVHRSTFLNRRKDATEFIGKFALHSIC